MTEEQMKKLKIKLLSARSRLALKNPFLAQLLMHVVLRVDDMGGTAGTNGSEIIFDPLLLDKLSDDEVEIVMMHEVLHLAFRHIPRGCGKDFTLYNIAADLVINDSILEMNGEDTDTITLYSADEMLAYELPEELVAKYDLYGVKCRDMTADQIYQLLERELEEEKEKQSQQEKREKGQGRRKASGSSREQDEDADAGRQDDDDDVKPNDDADEKRPGGAGDTDGAEADDGDGKEGGNMPGGVNASSGTSENEGKPGHGPSMDEAHRNLFKRLFGNEDIDNERLDSHDRWGEDSKVDEAFTDDDQQWETWIKEAAEADQRRSEALGIGSTSLLLERRLLDLYKPQINWRELLDIFLSHEVHDYTMNPPDARYDSTGFFIPSFTVPQDSIQNIVFYADTSGSIRDEQLARVYSEIKGCVDQYGGHVRAYLGFFDADATDPVPFESVDELLDITPLGGGFTDVEPAFRKIKQMDEQPASIVILTDGYLEYPPEEVAEGVPVLWIISGAEAELPQWGQSIRLDDEGGDV